MTTAVESRVPAQFKNAAKHLRDYIEALLEPFGGKELAAAQEAVAHVHRSARPATTAEWRERYRAAVDAAVRTK